MVSLRLKRPIEPNPLWSLPPYFAKSISIYVESNLNASVNNLNIESILIAARKMCGQV